MARGQRIVTGFEIRPVQGHRRAVTKPYLELSVSTRAIHLLNCAEGEPAAFEVSQPSREERDGGRKAFTFFDFALPASEFHAEAAPVWHTSEAAAELDDG